MNLQNSLTLWKKTSELIPNGTQCFSKGPTQFSFGACPIYLKKGIGAKVTDIDNNEYIDYGMGLHSVILGYGHPAVTQAVCQAAHQGISFTLMHPLETEIAQLLVDRIPSAQKVRFTKTGSEATSAAIRIARIITKKNHIAVCGYHGWHDWFLGITERYAGVPKVVQNMVSKFSYNDIESLKRIFIENPNQIAAVMMEPCGSVAPEQSFLNECQTLAHEQGALFILDETITGFRWHMGGAQTLFKITPDISIFGKSIANGMPLATVVGKKEVMNALEEEDAFFSSTYAGEITSLAAAQATQKILLQEEVIPFIWKQGQKLIEGFNQVSSSYDLHSILSLKGFPCRPILSITHPHYSPLLIKSYLQQECAKRGLLLTGYFAMSLAHSNEIIEETLHIMEGVMKNVQKHLDQKNLEKNIEGTIVSPVFRKL